MDLNRLEQQIMNDEGYAALAYQDTAGVWTLGYGSTRMYGIPVKELDICNVYQARTQMRADLYKCIMQTSTLFSNFNDLDSVRQEILVNMCYNLGRRGLSKFLKLREAIENNDFKLAAVEMVDSKWYKDVKTRGIRLVAAMKHGRPTTKG